MRETSWLSWGRSQFFAVFAAAGAVVVSQAACSGVKDSVPEEAFESQVTSRTLANRPVRGRPNRPTMGQMNNYCALLNVAGQTPPHHCDWGSCHHCPPGSAWEYLCYVSETNYENLVTYFAGHTLGTMAGFGIMTINILNSFAELIDPWLCGTASPNSFVSKWSNECAFDAGSPDCQAAKILVTCYCMHHADTRAGLRSTVNMDQNCEYCECMKQAKFAPADVSGRMNRAKFCMNQRRNRPGNGRTFGDPNLTSFDGTLIRDHRAGEFVALRKIDGHAGPDMEVQLRYEPVPGSTIASQVTAVAVRYEGTKIGLYAGDPGEVRVNGILATFEAEGIILDDNTEIFNTEDMFYEIYLPNGDLITVTNFNGLLNVTFQLTDDLLGHSEGVLGTFDQDSSNDPWQWGTNDFRITTAAQSLFDYAEGESVNTFNNPNFPAYMFEPNMASPQATAAANMLCSMVGITDPDVMEGCVNDAIITGNDSSFLASAAAMDLQAAGEPPIELPPDDGSAAPPEFVPMPDPENVGDVPNWPAAGSSQSSSTSGTGGGSGTASGGAGGAGSGVGSGGGSAGAGMGGEASPP